jgi:RNA recognition motif-containing protein
MAVKLYVGRLAYSTSDDTLKAVFADFGVVISAQVIKDRDSGQSKGFGFVEMETDDEAQAAIKGLNEKEVDGRTIIVNIARPPEPRGNAGGNNFRGGFQRR